MRNLSGKQEQRRLRKRKSEDSKSHDLHAAFNKERIKKLGGIGAKVTIRGQERVYTIESVEEPQNRVWIVSGNDLRKITPFDLNKYEEGA